MYPNQFRGRATRHEKEGSSLAIYLVLAPESLARAACRASVSILVGLSDQSKFISSSRPCANGLTQRSHGLQLTTCCQYTLGISRQAAAAIGFLATKRRRRWRCYAFSIAMLECIERKFCSKKQGGKRSRTRAGPRLPIDPLWPKCSFNQQRKYMCQISTAKCVKTFVST